MNVFEHLRADLRQAVRRTRARPVRSTIAVLMLSLGIAASTVGFSAVRAVLLEPLPVADQDRLVVLWQRSEQRSFDHVPFLPAALDPVRRMGGPLRGVAAVGTVGATAAPAEGDDGRFSIEWARVAGDFFGVLGARPALGRLLEPVDDEVGATPVAVISHGQWVDRLGARDDVLGTTLRIGGIPFEIDGVAPPDLDYPRGTEVWVTLRGSYPDWASEPATRFELDLVARLSPGSELTDAAAAVDALFAANQELSTLAADLRTTGTSFTDHVVGDLRPMLLATLIAGLMLLVVAIANTTLLFLAGGLRSAREVAVRRALGAGGARAARPLFADALLQSVMGVAAGCALAQAALTVLVPLAPTDFVRFSTIELDRLSLAVAAVFGIVALLGSAGLAGSWMTRRTPGQVLGNAFGSVGRGVVLRRVVAGGQVGLAVVAGVSAALLSSGVRQLEELDRGFEAEGLHMVSLRTPFDFFDAPAEYRGALVGASEALTARPGIQGVSPTFNAPLLPRGGIDFVPRVDDQSEDDALSNPYVGFDAVLPSYFEVAGTELREGRGFGRQDGPDDLPVVIVNEAAAWALWPEGGALGGRIFMGGLSREEWRTVVGIVEDHRFRTFPDAHPAVYVPLSQYDRFAPSRLLVRSSGTPSAIRSAVEEEIGSWFGGVDVVAVESLTEVMQRPMQRPRFAAKAVSALAFVTVLLAVLGVQGVLAVLVAEGRRAMGVRLALGARIPDLARYLAGHLSWIVGGGGAVGLIASAWGVRAAAPLLHGSAVGASGIAVWAAVTTVLLAIVAALHPLLRAWRIPPMEVLRSE